MPTRKNQTKSTPAKATAPAQENSVADHSHASLEASIAALKSEVESLRGQCHSCCAELSELLQLKSTDNQPSEDEKALSSRLDRLIFSIKRSQNMAHLKAFLKKNPLD